MGRFQSHKNYPDPSRPSSLPRRRHLGASCRARPDALALVGLDLIEVEEVDAATELGGARHRRIGLDAAHDEHVADAAPTLAQLVRRDKPPACDFWTCMRF
jgi:hypothetical protein